MADRLPDDVARAMAAATPRLRAFAQLRYAAEVASTNDFALALAAADAPEGTSVLAEVQHAGRGRRGRSWFSPPGAGIYLSSIVRPRGPAAALPLVTLAAGVAAARAIETATGLSVDLKWPNDVVIGRPWRKLGGILCEAVGGPRIAAVVVGIGINLLPAAYPADVADRATSLEGELGRPADRGILVAELLAALAEETAALWAGDTARLCDAWRRRAAAGLGGAIVRWLDGTHERRGIARDIDEAGALLVDVDGRQERLVSGEVLWERYSRD